ncbi:MAG: SurA N-terminal domain-containing protein [Elusimicrobia bacterium]|nr:SurA N-terminal domain-containing protein [Elusimicrobiota bacterium]
MRFIRKHKETMLLVTLGFFFLSIIGVGSYLFIGADARSLAAKVGKSKIKRETFAMNYRQALEGLQASRPDLEITADVENALRNDVLRELIIRELFLNEARLLGLRTTKSEVANDIARRPLFQTEGRFDPNKYYQFILRTLGVLPKDFEAERAKEMTTYKLRGLLSWISPPTPHNLEWLYRVERPTATAADFEKDRLDFAQKIQSEEAVALLNQLLIQLSQKNPVKTYLDQQ